MNKPYTILSAVLFFVIFLQGCEKSGESVTATMVSYSDCKGLEKQKTSDENPTALTCINYSYNSAVRRLSLVHINGGFNCCPGKISCSVTLKGDTLLIEEKEKSSLCDCNCLFDLEMYVDGVDQKSYFIEIEEPYAGDQAKLNFMFDPSVATEGSVCVTRNMYPWGVEIY